MYIRSTVQSQEVVSGEFKETVFAAYDVRRDKWSIHHFFTPTLEKLASVRKILTSGGRTLAQGALAWIWVRSGRTIPIPGFRNVAQAKENAVAMQFGPLKAEQMAEIDLLLERE